MSEKYTNLADSVIYAGFLGHQYNLKDSSGNPISKTYESKLDALLNEMIKNNNNDTLVLTLNQLCDNKFLLLEEKKQTYHFNLLKELLQSGKLKITVYGGFDLVSYTENALEQCLQRLCGGEVEPDRLYVSSLFPELGIENTNTPTKKGITLLLGWFPTDIRYDKERRQFQLNDDNFYSFNDLVDEATKKGKYGLYTILKKYEKSKVLTAEMCKIADKSFQFHRYMMKNWIQNLFELNRVAHENNAFSENVTTGIRLNDVINKLLDNVSLLDEKLNFWLGRISEKNEVKQGICVILKQLSEKHIKRTAMYIDIKDFMEDFAQEHKENQTLYKKFHTRVGKKAKKLPYQRVLFTIINIIDYCYNILNMFFAVESYEMIESFFSFKSISDNMQAVGLTKKVTTKYELETLIRQEV